MSDPTYKLHGWRSDGLPLIRQGTFWLTVGNVDKANQRIVLDMKVGDKKDITFKTAAGKIAYAVERVS